jgi:hypothetical protein
MTRRMLFWGGTCALVVLAARSVAYQLAPRPTLVGSTLEQAVGGPRLVVTTVVVLAVALALASAVVWLVTLGVRERHFLSGGPVPRPISIRGVAVSATLLFGASCAVFDALESYLHWRAGLGYHGIHCLVGPEHRDALPILAALSLVAGASVHAVRHLVSWMRRTLQALSARRRLPRPLVLPLLHDVAPLCVPQVWARRCTRGPPAVAVVL